MPTLIESADTRGGSFMDTLGAARSEATVVANEDVAELNFPVTE